MQREVKIIAVSDLRLWTENPRDPIDHDASDAEIIGRALESDKHWDLDRMLEEMGDFYDYSELPTVVIENEKYIVYDGNRRVAVLKCLLDHELYAEATKRLPLFTNASDNLLTEREIPCAVFDRDTAIESIERKHRSSRNWGSLEYEYFLHVHRGKPKGRLVLFEEASGGLVSANPKLNEEYVQQRLLTDKNLADVGLAAGNDQLQSIHNDKDTQRLLQAISDVRANDLSNARINPGQLRKALIQLDSCFEKLPGIDSGKTPHSIQQPIQTKAAVSQKPKRRTSTTKTETRLFGGTLELSKGKTNDIYVAITEMYKLYEKNANLGSGLLPVICMSLRLLLETAAQEYYFEKCDDHGDNALKDYCKLIKTLLREQLDESQKNSFALLAPWLDDDTNTEAILQKWAHGTLPADRESAVRQSQILAGILQLHHGRKSVFDNSGEGL